MSEYSALNQLLSVLSAAGFEPVPAPRTYTRDDLIRVVMGQQWAVAIACHFDNHFWVSIEGANLADLPCAVDVVDGLG